MLKQFVLAFSGALGSGKSDLSKDVAGRLGWARASFGQQVRKVAIENGRDGNDRAVLQSLGQALVLTNLRGFVDDTLAQAEGSDRIVLDGIRHVEVLQYLRDRQDVEVRLVHVDTPSDIRHERHMKRDSVERRLVARYESDITEAQITRILPQYAGLVLDGTLPTSILTNMVTDFARKEASIAEKAEAA